MAAVGVELSSFLVGIWVERVSKLLGDYGKCWSVTLRLENEMISIVVDYMFWGAKLCFYHALWIFGWSGVVFYLLKVIDVCGLASLLMKLNWARFATQSNFGLKWQIWIWAIIGRAIRVHVSLMPPPEKPVLNVQLDVLSKQAEGKTTISDFWLRRRGRTQTFHLPHVGRYIDLSDRHNLLGRIGRTRFLFCCNFDG